MQFTSRIFDNGPMRFLVGGVLVTAVCLVGITPARAQSGETAFQPRNWYGSIGLGGSYNQYKGDFISTAEGALGFYLSGRLMYRTPDRIAVGFEVNLVQQRSNDIITSNPDSLQWLNITYLQIPAIVRYHIPLGTSWELGIHGGVGLNIKTSANLQLVGESISRNSVAYAPVGEAESTMWSIPFGIGVGKYVGGGTGAVLLEFRYDLGVSNVLKNSANKVTTSAFEFLVGYAFCFN